MEKHSQLAKEGLANDPANIRYQFYLGEILFRQKNYEYAEQEYMKRIKLQGDSEEK